MSRVTNAAANTNSSDGADYMELANENASDGNQENIISRKFYMDINGSLNDLAANPDWAKWTPQSIGSNFIFQSVKAHKQGTLPQVAKTRTGDLKNVILHGIDVLRSQSNFPISLGVNMTGAERVSL